MGPADRPLVGPFVVAIYPSVEDALSKAVASYPEALKAGLRHRLAVRSVAGLSAAMYVADLIGRLDTSLEWVRYGSVFRYYGRAIEDGIDPLSFAGLVAAAVAVAALGTLLFERRDLSG